MNYDVDFKPRALKDMKSIPKSVQRRLIAAIERLADDWSGDVKHLTDFTPEYRLRVGHYRVLFDLDEAVIVIYRILHRKDAY